MSERVVDHLEQTVLDEVGVELRSGRCLEVLRDGTALLDEMHGTLLPLLIWLLRVEQTEELAQKGLVGLQMLHDVDLVEEDERVRKR